MKEKDPISRESAKQAEIDESDLLVLGKWTTRLIAALADFFLALVLAVFLFSVPLSFAFHIYDDFSKYNQIQDSIISTVLTSRLNSKDADGNFKTDAVLAKEFIIGKVSGNEKDEDGHYVDILAGYTIEYKGESIGYYNVNVLGLPASVDGENSSPYWTYPAGAASIDEGLGVFKDEVKQPVADFLSSRSTNSEMYSLVSSFFISQHQAMANELAEAPTYLGYFQDMVDTYSSLGWHSSWAAEIAFYSSAVIFYLVIPLFLHGQTIGKKILKLKVTREDGSPLGKGRIAIRGVVEILTVSFGFTLVPLFSTWGTAFMNIPFLQFGDARLTFGVTMAATFLVCLISFIMVMANKNRRAFHDLAAGSFVYTTDIKQIAEEAKILKSLQAPRKE